LPWSGMEKHRYAKENPADRKAAEKMAKLYDSILDENKIYDSQRRHDLNVFLSRILFCFFAEDTNIFKNKIFTNSIASHTQSDGTDLDRYLSHLFNILNTENRDGLPNYLNDFPYVNGGLFKENHWIPKFSGKSRQILIQCGELDWSQINPDIFGSMMQAVVDPQERGNIGMHYTSVPNIMKVIKPLFLDELNEEFEHSIGNKQKLFALLSRISKIKFLDPACGSGNFLIIAYKELRRLEMKILKELRSVSYLPSNLKNFYGIEKEDFACQITSLSLYIAEHQMNVEFEQQFGKKNPTLPLKAGGHIVCDNATRVDWEEICPKGSGEIFILGNPPYLGARMQDPEQKKDMKICCGNIHGYNNLDYIACWFIKASEYIKGSDTKFAFVSTNSISQGTQVSILWPHVLDRDLEIDFAYRSFKWLNNAKKNAGVICVIIGIRNISKAQKYIYDNNIVHNPNNINAYLLDGPDIYIEERKRAVSDIPPIKFGSMANDGGNLFLNEKDFLEEKQKNLNLDNFVKQAYGAQEFIRGIKRYCLWVTRSQWDEAQKNDFVQKRVHAVEAYRLKSKRKATRELASLPYRFGEVRQEKGNSIIIPRVSSERRDYIPFGFLDDNSIILDSAQAIYNAEPWIFGIISSRMHMVWVQTLAGRLKTDYRYSARQCYNTFPIPSLTFKQKEEIEMHVYEVLGEREVHSEKTIAELYDPLKMPKGLKEAHRYLDLAVERCYRSKPFIDDEERLGYLFNLYNQLTNKEKYNRD